MTISTTPMPSLSARTVRTAYAPVSRFTRKASLGRAVRGPARSSPGAVLPTPFSKRALQAGTLRALDDARRLDRDLLSRGMTEPGSLRAHARRYRELKG